MNRFVPRITPLYLLLLAAGSTASAQPIFEQKAINPFDSNNDDLPDLGMTPENYDGERHPAGIARDFSEANINNNGLDTGEQARAFTLGRVRNALNQRANQHVESQLSPWGNAGVDVKVDDEGYFTGSCGSWFVPLQGNDRYLIWSQLGLTQQNNGLVNNVGVERRWAYGNWLVGYNIFCDSLLDGSLQRTDFGVEAWGKYLRLSANFYQPFIAWHKQIVTQEQRMTHGYDLTARMRMPFYQRLNTSVSLEQYFGDRVDLFNSGTGYHNLIASSLELNCTPVPSVTAMAQHKQGGNDGNQNNLGLNLNYRFGVPLKE